MIYMDYNSTTPVDERVLEQMLPYFREKAGNAASRSHAFGWIAEEAVANARKQIANALSADVKEIVFTSGATESDNLAIKGIFENYYRKGKHIVTLESEHNAVLDTCARLEIEGAEITYLGVNRNGLVDLDELKAAIRTDTVLVSIMWANNETGVIQPMKAIGQICAEKDVLLMSDATQAVGKIEVKPKDMGVHLLAFTAHKIYGPKGIGALYVSQRNPRVKLKAQIDGGGHERGMRSGTLNVPGIVGLGAAVSLAETERIVEFDRLKRLRDRLETIIIQEIEEVKVNGDRESRLPHVSNVSVKLVEGEKLMMTFNHQLAISSGSACTSASLDPSHVLIAMGLSEEEAHGSLRFSLGRFSTEAHVDKAIQWMKDGVEKVRSESPIWEMYKNGVDLGV